MSAVSDEIRFEGIVGLGAAIVLQAAEDWRRASKRRGQIVRLDDSVAMDADEVMREVEAFLVSDYCAEISPVPGKRVLKMLMEGK